MDGVRPLQGTEAPLPNGVKCAPTDASKHHNGQYSPSTVPPLPLSVETAIRRHTTHQALLHGSRFIFSRAARHLVNLHKPQRSRAMA